MTPTQLMDRLLDCHPNGDEKRERIHAQGTYYVHIAELGYDLFDTMLQAPTTTWCQEFLGAVEEGLRNSSHDTYNLIVAGLFESLQSQSYRLGPADLLESRLGPRSLQVWANLMEGWSGPGIRSVAAWRQVR